MAYLVKRSEFESYFEAIARKYKPINHSNSQKHFFKNIDDFLKSKPKAKVMVLVTQPTRFIDKGSDNILKVRSFKLWIIDTCSMENVDRQNKIYEETEKDCDNICALLKFDRDKYPVDTRPVTGFEINNATVESIGPMGADNWFGSELTIPMTHPAPLVYNANDSTLWNP